MWLGLFLALSSTPLQAAPSVQDQLLQTYGVLAVDQTDRHAPVVLESFLYLLQHAFTPGFVRGLKGLRYLYAYAGHDDVYDLAAYHPGARAISIGGRTTYGEAAGGGPDLKILMTLAHEMGHAFLLERVPIRELQEVGAKFGGWGPEVTGRPLKDFYAKELFARHPASAGPSTAHRAHSVCSRLALRNVHEWFADAFAAVILRRLGEAGALGKSWKSQVVFEPAEAGEYWYDYTRVSEGFARWLNVKLSSR